MSLQTRLGPSVAAKLRHRGEEYLRHGQVVLRESGPDRVEAVVTGTEDYDVLLTRDGPRLLASCTCPFSDRGTVCKHVWATVLAADQDGALRGPRGTMPEVLNAVSADSGPSARADAGRGPAWREPVDQEEPAGPADPAAEGEIFYVVDAAATERKQKLALHLRFGATPEEARPLAFPRARISELPESRDRQILSVVDGAFPRPRYWQPNVSSVVPPDGELPESAAPVLVPLMCATGRCRLRTRPADPADRNGEPIAWDEGPAYKLWLEVRAEADGGVSVTGSLRRGEERLDCTEPAAVLRSGTLFFAGRDGRAGRASRFHAYRSFSWAAQLRRAGALRAAAGEADELLERLFASPDLPPVEIVPPLAIEEVRPAPRPRLRLRAPAVDDHRYRDFLRGALSFEYAAGDEAREVPAGEPGGGFYLRGPGGERRRVMRDRIAELAAADRLRTLGLRALGREGETPELRLPRTRLIAVLRTLLDEGWSVEAEGKLYRPSGRFEMGIGSGIDWFELHGEAEFDGQTVHLPELLAALARGERFVPLADGSLGLLPEEWERRLAPVAGLGAVTDEGVRFQNLQAPLLDAWLAAEPEVHFDETFARARERLQSFAGVSPAEPPSGFRGELRPYQRTGLGWLHYLRDFGFGGCLADDMGLGKTVQVLALLESRREARAAEGLGPSLVVVPRSLIFNWQAEAERFAPGLRVLDHTGVGRAREGEALADWDVVLTTYGTLRRDLGALTAVEFDYVILDEAQAIKNGDSQTAKAARLLRGRHRLALTGTPIENHLGELWSLLEFLNPGLLGSTAGWRERARRWRDPEPESRAVLARAVRPFLLRRTKEAVAPELPERIEQTLICELPPRQRKLYDELRDHYRSELGARIGEAGIGRSKILVLEALLRLRQAACHPALVDAERRGEPSAKLDLLLPLLQEVIDEGHKALVFSQFTSFLSLLREPLDREGIPYLYLDGRTRDRQEQVERFQSDPSIPLFLISLKAGGVGLNLTAADYVYLLDPWWNPAVEAQAIDRAHRIGQTRTVIASRLVARDTVEEKILALQDTKRELADAIVQADESLLASLSREDLELLLS